MVSAVLTVPPPPSYTTEDNGDTTASGSIVALLLLIVCSDSPWELELMAELWASGLKKLPFGSALNVTLLKKIQHCLWIPAELFKKRSAIQFNEVFRLQQRSRNMESKNKEPDSAVLPINSLHFI